MRRGGGSEKGEPILGDPEDTRNYTKEQFQPLYFVDLFILLIFII
jgi:hypothetical protein